MTNRWFGGSSDDGLVLTALVMLLLDRLLLILHFGVRFTGVDDVVLWQAAEDYSHGVFREPLFYGQDYGYLIESVCAVPLLWVGVPHHIALPVITSFLAVMPFLILAWLFRRQGSPVAAALCLLVPVTLPIEYAIITGMSRGFVTGLPFAAALACCWFIPDRRKGLLLFGTLASLAFLANPNTVPIICLTGGYLLLTTPFRPLWYLLTALPALPFFWLDRMAKAFYTDHPEYIVHWMPKLEYDWSEVLKAMSDLDRYFKHLGPLVWNAGWLWLLIILGMGIWMLRRDKAWGTAVIATVVAMLLMLGINKVRDGWENIFHTRERMYLSFPVIMALTLAWAARLATWKGPTWRAALLVLGAAMIAVKSGYYAPVVRAQTATEDQGPVAIVLIERLEQDCMRLAALAEVTGADVLVFQPDESKTMCMQGTRVYACPLMQRGMKDTFLIVGERRTWMYLKQVDRVPGKVLLYGRFNLPDHARTRYDVLQLDHDLVLVGNNGSPLAPLLADLGITLKRHPYM